MSKVLTFPRAIQKSWFHIENLGQGKARIEVRGVIGGWDVNAQTFMDELQALGEVEEIELLVDSPGGSVTDGWTIYNALEQHPAHITATVIGTAASMASVIILAADVIQLPENAWIMVHRARGGMFGTHEEQSRMAEATRVMEDNIVQAYVARTGLEEAEVREMMATVVGTWMNGKTAVEKGFADKVMPKVRAVACVEWAAELDFVPGRWFDSVAGATPAGSPPPPNLDDAMTADEIQAAIQAGVTEGINAFRDTQTPLIQAAIQEAVTTALEPVTTELATATATITTLQERVTTAEALVRSGVAGAAGGTAGLEGLDDQTPVADQLATLRQELATTVDPAARGKLTAKIAALRKA